MVNPLGTKVDGDDMAQLAKARVRARELDKAARERGKLLGDAGVARPRAFRVAVLGDAEVGKTAFCRAAAGERFDEDYHPTMDDAGPREVEVTVRGPTGPPALITLVDWAWDQMYQVKQVDLAPHLARAKDGGVFVFSYAHPDSFKNLPIRFHEFDRLAGGKPPALFLGNKTDAPKLRVKDGDVWDAVRKRSGSDFAATCCASGEGVTAAVGKLAKLLLGFGDDESWVCQEATPGRSDAYVVQLGRHEAFARLAGKGADELAAEISAHLGLDDGLAPSEVAEKALAHLGLKADATADIRDELGRCGVLLGVPALVGGDDGDDDGDDALGGLAAGKRAPAAAKDEAAAPSAADLAPTRAGKESDIPNFKGSDLGRFPLAPASAEATRRAEEENVRRAERLKAKVLEREKRAREEAAEKSAKKRDAEEAARRRKAVEADPATLAADDAVLNVDRRKFARLKDAVSAEWPSCMLHFHDHVDASRRCSLRLKIPEAWRDKPLDVLLDAANPKIAAKAAKNAQGGKRKGAPKHVAHIRTLRCEAMFGADLAGLSIYEAVSQAQGCIFLRQPRGA
ncbi:hypothetical protein SO694_00010179 [Aureococcus anophagefferens]|uniref:Uncharacterized protein n=1 Tax=Aureococcus anophagefferens TaxID=44056 RepID=A0ABR1GEV1_AURAN